MLVEFLVFNIFNFILLITSSNNFTNKRTTIDDDYYLNYDYEIPNNSMNLELKSDSLLLPNPENIDSKYTVDVLPNVELPDDSLADTDLRDHDFIDNLMYVYYGSSNKNNSRYGPEIIIIGSVLSCAAQLLTILCLLLKKNLNGKKEIKTLFLHLMLCLCCSNLLFMLGVYAIRNRFKCFTIALILHYLHLLTAFWIFLYCYYIYKKFTVDGAPKITYLIAFGYGIPLLLSIFSSVLAPNSFEIKRFCFISVQKGMILNYMLPVSALIVMTTIYCLNGIRKINIELSKLEFSSSAESLNALRNDIEGGKDKNKPDLDEEVASLRESKTCLKLLCSFQTAYDIVWFVIVLALENNNDSVGMSVVYTVLSSLVNWYVFIRTKSFLPSLVSARTTLNIDDLIIPQEAEKSLTSLVQGSSDSIPLLVNTENGTELRELRLDYISTISN